jgi:hypothetical protein
MTSTSTISPLILNIGDPVIFQITGCIGNFLGEVTGIILDKVVLKVTENGPYSILKVGDYIIDESSTHLYQLANQGDKNAACEFIKLNETLKLASGLNTHGITDDKLRYINFEAN